MLRVPGTVIIDRPSSTKITGGQNERELRDRGILYYVNSDELDPLIPTDLLRRPSSVASQRDVDAEFWAEERIEKELERRRQRSG